MAIDLKVGKFTHADACQMSMRKRYAIGGLGLVALTSSPFWSPHLKPLLLAPAYEHDKYGTRPTDVLRQFEAFTLGFDSADDDNGD